MAFLIEVDADETKLLKNFDQGMDKAEERISKLKDNASSISLGVSSGGSDASGNSRRGGLSNPWEDLDRAVAARSAAFSDFASEGTLMAHDLNVKRLGKRVSKAEEELFGKEPKSFAERAMDTLMTSRIGARGIMPLFNRLAGLFGANTLGAGIVADAGYRFMEEGSQLRRSLGSAHYIGGGNAAQDAGVAGIGAYLGRSPQESAQAAVSFGQSLRQGSYGAGYFRSRGLIDTPLTINKDTNYLKAVSMLANEPNEATAIRVARETGLSDELWMRDLPRADRESLINNMNFAQSPGERRSEARYQKTKADIAGWWSKTVRQNVSQDWGEFASELILNGATMGIYGLIKRSGLGGDWVNFFLNESQDPGGSKSRTPQGSNMSSQPRVTPGMVGADRHGTNAAPAAFKNANLDSAMYGQMARMGAFPTYTI